MIIYLVPTSEMCVFQKVISAFSAHICFTLLHLSLYSDILQTKQLIRKTK